MGASGAAPRRHLLKPAELPHGSDHAAREEGDVGEGGPWPRCGTGRAPGPARRGGPGPATGRRSARAAIRPARPRGRGEQWPPAKRRWGGSSTHRQSWSLASAGSVEEPQFEFHRLVIQDGQAVVITAVAVEQALYTSGQGLEPRAGVGHHPLAIGTVGF